VIRSEETGHAVMTSSPNGTAKARLREQVRREQRLADAVLSAETRLATEIGKRDAAMAVHNAAVAARRRALADALAIYLDDAGVSVARAAAVFDRPRHEITRLLREHRNTPAVATAVPEGDTP
jgi:hypothetical protein